MTRRAAPRVGACLLTAALSGGLLAAGPAIARAGSSSSLPPPAVRALAPRVAGVPARIATLLSLPPDLLGRLDEISRPGL